MSTQQSKLDIIIDTRSSEQQAKDMTRVLLALEQAGIRASRSNSTVGTSSSALNTTSNAVRTLTGSVNQSISASQRAEVANHALRASFVGMTATVASSTAVYLAWKSVLAATDEYRQMEGQIRLVTKTQEQADEVLRRLTASAQNSAVELSTSVDLYTKTAKSMENFNGASDELLLRLTDVINKFAVIGGTGTQQVDAGLLQLGQALGSNTVQWEELSGVMDGTPAIFDAIVKGMGITRGELRQMLSEGKVTPDMLVNALLKMGNTADEQFGSLERTSKQAMIVLKREIKEATKQLDDQMGVTDAYIKLIGNLSDSINQVKTSAAVGEFNALDMVIGTLAGVTLYKLLSSLKDTTTAIYAKVAASRVAILAAKDQAIADAGAARSALLSAEAENARATLAANAARQAVISAESKVFADRQVMASEIQRMQSTISQIEVEKALEAQRLSAQITDQGRQASITRMAELRRVETVVTRELQLAESQLTATMLAGSQAVTAATNAEAAATARQTAAKDALTVANERVAASQAVVAATTNTTGIAARGLLGVLGGPVGLVMLLAALAGGYWAANSASNAMKKSTDELTESLKKTTQGFKDLTYAQQQQSLSQAAQQNIRNIEAIKDQQNKFLVSLTSLVSDLGGQEGEKVGEILRSVTAGTTSYADALRQVSSINMGDNPFAQKRLDELRNYGAALDVARQQATDYSKATMDLVKVNKELEKSLKANGGVGVVTTKNPFAAGDSEAQKMLDKLKEGYSNDKDPSIYGRTLRELEQLAKDGKPVSEEVRNQLLSQAKAWDALNASQKQAIASGKQAKKDAKEEAREREQRQKAFNDLVDESSKSGKISKEFLERSQLIREFTKEGSAEYTRLTNWAISEQARENAEIARKHRQALDQYTNVLDTEEQIIRTKYNDMRDEVKHFADYSEAERERALAGIQKMEEKELQAYRDKTSQLRASFDERYRLRFDFDQKLKAIDEDPNLTPDQKEMGANVVRNQHNDGIKSLNQPYNDMMSELGGTSELDRLKADEEAKMTIIRDALTQRQITEEEAAAARLDVERNYMASRNDLLMSQGEQMLGSMSSIMKAMGGEQSKAYKVMFAIEKGVSIARSIMAIQTGIALAAATPFPANLGAMASVAAATANIVGSIQSIKLAGQAHDGIDYVPREGTWLLDKGERVLSPRQNADLDRFMQDGGAKGGGTMMNVEVHNYGSSDIQVEQVSDDRIRIIARDVAQSEIARDGGRTAATALSNPNSDMSKGVSRNFNVERRRS